jgi:shikimate kinase
MSKNIVLIGMPGSGKTTIGKILSKKLGLKLLDVDKCIEEKSKQSIPELFKLGENFFRNIEREVISELSNVSSSVIATGGGVVKNYENIKELKKNGVIIFIDRPVEIIEKDIKISNRPLLKDKVNTLYELFTERYELYKEYSNFQVINDSTLEEVVEKIIEIVNINK